MDEWRIAASAMTAAAKTLEAVLTAGLITGDNKSFVEDLMDAVSEAKERAEVVAATRRAITHLLEEHAKLTDTSARMSLMKLTSDLELACNAYIQGKESGA